MKRGRVADQDDGTPQRSLRTPATFGYCVDAVDDVRGAFARFAALRRPRAQSLAKESRIVGRIVNARPAFLGAAGIRASSLVPEVILTRHLASVAGRAAFVLPNVR